MVSWNNGVAAGRQRKTRDTKQRRQQIEDLIAKRDFLRIAELSRMFDVSEVAIRRDLAALDLSGALKRVRGGAINTGRMAAELSFQAKMKRCLEEKHRIAAVASSLVRHGDVIYLDTGSTIAHLARQISSKLELTVVTRSFPVAVELGPRPGVRLFWLGGLYDPRSLATLGTIAFQGLSRFHFTQAFVGVEGLSAQSGLSLSDPNEADMYAVIFESSDVVTVLTDYTKLGKTGFVQRDFVPSIRRVITDSKADEGMIQSLRELGIEVIVA